MTGGTTIYYSPLTLAVTLAASATTALGTLVSGLATSHAIITAAGAALTATSRWGAAPSLRCLTLFRPYRRVYHRTGPGVGYAAGVGVDLVFP